MTSRTLRRRIHHRDVGGKSHEHLETSGLDGLDEPLLEISEYDDRHSKEYTLEDLWQLEYEKEQIHWNFIFSHLVADWAQWFANIVLGSGSYIGRLIPLPSSRFNERNLRNIVLSLEPLQEALKHLWMLAYPDRELPHLKSEKWKEMGWQGPDPSTDFRGGGLISLENLIFFAKTYPESFQRLLYKRQGKRAEWEYPFAVAGINISFMLTQMLNLQSGKPTTIAGIQFLQLLKDDDMAFDNLFCVAFEILDAHWLAKRASYMEFNEILKFTRTQLERELALEDISSVKDLPAYNMLRTS